MGWSKPHSNLLDFFSLDTEQKVYILGLLAADGCVYIKPPKDYRLTISLHKEDRSLLETVSKLIFPCAKVNIFNNMAIFSIRSKSLVEQLGVWGIKARKTLSMQTPNYLTQDSIPHWVRGYLDGDGSVFITKTHGLALCFTGQLNIVNYIKGWFEEGHPEYCVKPHKKRGSTSTWTLKYKGRAAIALAKLVYENSSIHMDRKYLVCEPYLREELPPYRYKSIVHGNHTPWTSKEDAIIKENLLSSPKKLEALLPSRTRSAIKKRLYVFRKKYVGG